MEEDGNDGWASLRPPFHLAAKSLPILLKFARAASKVIGTPEDDEGGHALETLTQAYLDAEPDWPKRDRELLRAAGLVVSDLLEQGWSFRVHRGGVQLRPQEVIDADPLAEKARVRQQELVKRDEQLRHPAVREFVRSMERRRVNVGRFVSVFSLMRDGRELAAALKTVRGELTNGTTGPLDRVIAPYLQVVSQGERCAFTGLLLQDIWRYFRHTWTNQYTSVPGRSMMFLVRDAAADNHPVIGIAALSSPIVQIRERDEWIGWLPSTFIAEARAKPSTKLARWLLGVIDGAIADTYIDDLLADKVLARAAIKGPTPDAVEKLRTHGTEQRKRHHEFMNSADYKRASKAAEGDWVVRAKTHLFRSKRTLALAELLHARMIARRHLGAAPTAQGLRALLADSEGSRIVGHIVRRAKGERVGIAMADISVCGAVPPYNAILGGKLVSMLITSPEVVAAYRARYTDATSEIASAMAGRPIMRPPDLVFLGTTSLYGGGSSQYNRIRIPCAPLGGDPNEEIDFKRLGMSESFGTSQFSEETVDALASLAEAKGQRRVNSVFGEGVSPKLRKLREGLSSLGGKPELLLRHGRHRIVYGVTLIRNTRDFLLGIDKRPKYRFDPKLGVDGTRAIADWWKARWLRNRISSDEVLAQVAAHTPVHPFRHGARVTLPPDGRQGELPLGESA